MSLSTLEIDFSYFEKTGGEQKLGSQKQIELMSLIRCTLLYRENQLTCWAHFWIRSQGFTVFDFRNFTLFFGPYSFEQMSCQELGSLALDLLSKAEQS